MNFILKQNNILTLVLILCLSFMIGLFFLFEYSIPERIILPILISSIIGGFIFVICNVFFKDKFIAKAYLISVLLHFIFILFWQIIKYYILGLPMPTDYNLSVYISDTDGRLYHFLASYIADNYSARINWGYTGGLFPKILATLYFLCGKNPFLGTCLNSIMAGFISIYTYLISKQVLKKQKLCKIYTLFCILCTSFIVNTSVLIRDVYITLFIYLSIYESYNFLENKKIFHGLLMLLSPYLIYLFRPYAAITTLLGIALGYLFKNIKYRTNNKYLKVNKLTGILFILSPIIIVCIVLGITYMLNSSMLFVKDLSVETLIDVRETAYAGSASDYPWDFGQLFRIFPLLPFVVGYICLLFAPFPYEWGHIKRLHFVPDMIVLYCFIPSFIKNIKKIFMDKNYYLLVFFFTILCMFTIYSITIGNSGTVHRLRGPYIPMIYLIAMYRPDKFLSKILDKIQSWRII